MSKDTQQLLNLYALFGDDDLKRFEARKKLQARFADAGMIDFDLQSFKKSSQGVAEFLSACNSMSFSGSLRLVELEVDGELSKDEIDQIVSYIQNPFDQTVALFLFLNLAKNTRIYKALAAYNPKSLISCEAPKKYQLATLVQNQAAAHKLKLNKECANLIVERLGENRFLIETMLQKLALKQASSDSYVITPEDILESIPETSQSKPWDVADACCLRDLEGALKAFRRLPEEAIFPLLSLTARRIRELITLKSCECEGLGANYILKLPDWKLRQYKHFASQFSLDDLWRMTAGLIECETLYKSAQYRSLYFESWLFKYVPKQ